MPGFPFPAVLLSQRLQELIGLPVCSTNHTGSWSRGRGCRLWNPATWMVLRLWSLTVVAL